MKKSQNEIPVFIVIVCKNAVFNATAAHTMQWRSGIGELGVAKRIKILFNFDKFQKIFLL